MISLRFICLLVRAGSFAGSFPSRPQTKGTNRGSSPPPMPIANGSVPNFQSLPNFPMMSSRPSTVSNANYMAAMFAQFEQKTRVKMNIPEVWYFTHDNFGKGPQERALCEPFLDNFSKFNSNTTESKAESAAIANALSHFSYDYSKGDYLLCDIQGGVFDNRDEENDEEEDLPENREYTLSDVVIMTKDRRCGPADLGLKGIETWFSEHECNQYCKRGWKCFPGARQRYEPTMFSTMEERVDSEAGGGEGETLEKKFYSSHGQTYY